jgi:uncharacterized protein with HEPN domain
MTRRARERLLDIREAITFVEEHVGGSMSHPEIAGPLVLHAVLFNLVVIGEAAKNIDDVLRSEAPDVPWSSYAGLRDVIAHQYFRVQRETVKRDLPILRAAVDRLLAERPPA